MSDNINDMIQELRVLAYPQKSHRNAGRKSLPLELRSPNKRYCVWLNPILAERVREIGKGSGLTGSISKGIEILDANYANV